MEQKKEFPFKPGDLVYYQPLRKKRGLRPPIERGIVLGIQPSGIAVKLNSGDVKYVKVETLAHQPEALAAP